MSTSLDLYCASDRRTVDVLLGTAVASKVVSAQAEDGDEGRRRLGRLGPPLQEAEQRVVDDVAPAEGDVDAEQRRPRLHVGLDLPRLQRLAVPRPVVVGPVLDEPRRQYELPSNEVPQLLGRDPA